MSFRSENLFARDRRTFLNAAAHSLASLATVSVVGEKRNYAIASQSDSPTEKSIVVDTHMHVWANDASRYPFQHPYQQDFDKAPHDGTVEMLIEDMDQHGCTHAVLVQVIYHGWDNRYIADCVRRFPDRLRAHGLIDPKESNVADKLEYWMKEHGLHGMRFSPIYYKDGQHGGDGWLDADETHRLWKKAESLSAVFNFFIAPRQLPKLAKMVSAHPGVCVIIDHLSQVDLKAADPEPDVTRLIEMARYENVCVKVSELSSVSSSGTYPFTDAYPFVKRVYEAFGPDRLLFGTGYPGSARAHYHRPTLDREIALFNHMPFLSTEDRSKILGRNAKRLWGLAV